MPFLNAAAYRFAELTSLPELRTRLKTECGMLGLKGSILLSTEGINLFLAGEQGAVKSLLATLRQVPGLAELEAKFSESAEQPFNRMLVKIKNEIIAFGVEGIHPARRTAPRLPARTLKQWLDEGRPVTLLDTRNTYEVKLGTFSGAITLPIRHFRKFPEAVRALPETIKRGPVITFCTGGIRCEKAAPFLETEGFREVYQLEGGILKYFEECGGAHWSGECFVFDKRVAVDPGLAETGSSLCFACQEPLTPEETKDPRYVYGKSCPACFRK
jgi:predicted sulfurtransferase